MRAISIPILLALAFAAGHARPSPSEKGTVTPGDQGQRGTICVLPNSPEPPTRISPGGMYNPATLAVSIDKGKPILWPHKRSVRIENLTLNERHLIALTSDGKRIQSFWFRFSINEPRLCLSFDGYQGAQFGDLRMLCGASASDDAVRDTHCSSSNSLRAIFISLLGNTEAPSRRFPIDPILPQTPGAHPCQLDGLSPVFSEVSAPATFGGGVAPFAYGRPIWNIRHIERLPIRIQEQVCEYDIGNITRGRVTPIIFYGVFRPGGVCQLGNEYWN